MNYRHSFHAGNFADVFKHVILVQLLLALQRKDAAFAYLETHAGAARYDLQAPDAQKTGEYRDGIARLWGDTAVEEGIAQYVAAVRAVNAGNTLRYYPGSTRIARFLRRPQDRMRLAEQVGTECARLRREFDRDAQVTVHCGDGYAALQRWLPPPERRGLVFIDPPYESAEEWERLVDTLTRAAKRWAQGTYAVWYPLKAAAPVERFKAALAASGLRKMLLAELALWPLDSPFRLNGCGMLILNPPWLLDTALAPLLERLAARLAQGPTAAARVEWLVPE